jgi:hypothetical protein
MAKSLPILSILTRQRWLPLLCVVILLHALMLLWAFSHFSTQFSRSDSATAITIELLPLPEPKPVIPQFVPIPESTPETPANKTTPQIASSAKKIPDTSLPPATDNLLKNTSVVSNVGRNLPTYQIVAPPSAELKFRVHQLRGLRNESGSGMIRWQNSGAAYKIQGALEVQNANVLVFLSDGVFDRHGVSPLIYSINRNGLAEITSNFHRERNTISFSTSEKYYPRLGGEQDTASVIWQLAGIGRHDAAAFKTDAEFHMFVADANNADLWLIRVVGLEEIDTPLGKLQAWHLLRAAPAGTQEQTVEFWLAPEKEWYPVRLRYTEANGDSLDLTVSEITLVPDT